MKKRLLILLTLCLFAIPMTTMAREEIIVLAAASMTDAVNEIIENYKSVNPGVTVTASYDSSGKLQTQIEQGAPADVFISAAQKQMDALQAQGLIDEESRFDLLENKVVLILPEGKETPCAFEDIACAGVIAIGDPDVVPAGQYAKTALTNLGLWEGLEAEAGKLILAGNVREVLTYVATGNVDAGIVYATDARIEPSVVVVAEAPEGSVDKIIYPAAVLKETGNKEAAQEFLAYVAGEEGAKVLAAYGFTVIEDSAE